MLPPLRIVLPALALSAACVAGCGAAELAAPTASAGPAASASPTVSAALAAGTALAAAPAPVASLAGPPRPAADPSPPRPTTAAPADRAPPEPPPGTSRRLALDAARMALPAGRSLVDVEIPAGQYISILVLGRAEALLGFDVLGPPALRPLRAHRPLDEDGLLPRALSFRAPEGAAAIQLLVDVETPVELARTAAEAPEEIAPHPPGKPRPPALELPLIGMPVPLAREDGYLLQSPARYQFARADVARALLAAFRQTRRRFRREPIAIADISQWDGRKPKSDLGAPRHISHELGRDVDLALPALLDEPSTVRAHCAGVFVAPEHWVCAPGTAEGVDALRLAYFLGLLLDGSPEGAVTAIFTDEVYIREIRRAAETLRERRWIKPAGLAGLLDERLLRPSAYHTDHVHVRFGGAPARPAL